MGIIEIKDLSFSYSGSEKKALEQISLTVEEGEFLVLCGISGCGKSTLLRQLKPVLAPFGERQGKILFEGEDLWEMDERTQASSIGYVLQNPEQQIVTEKVWHELAFGLESLGESQRTIRLRVAEMSAYFGLEPIYHKRTDELSGGQKQLLNLASVMAMNPKVLLLDEPTSQLDPIIAANFLATVKKINRELGITVILTEHRLSELFGLADRIALMGKGTVEICDTPRNIAGWIAAQKHEMYGALPSTARIYHELMCEKDPSCANGRTQYPMDVKEGRTWFRTYMKEQQSQREKMTEENAHFSERMQEMKRNQEQTAKDRADVVLECRDVWFRYERDLPDILKGFSMSARRSELYCLLGGNGAGKSTAMSVLCGLYQPYRGKVHLKGKDISKYSAKELYHGLLGVVPQNPQCLFVTMRVRDELAEMLETKENRADSRGQKIEEIAKLLHLSHLLDRHPYDLSGGEQQRLAIAKVLLLEPEILLMDEPTKGLDCQRKQELAQILSQLKERGITILIVSHDIEFCAKYGDTCGILFDGGLATQAGAKEFFAGNSFYTTAANRMVRQILPEAVTTGDVVAAVKGGVL